MKITFTNKIIVELTEESGKTHTQLFESGDSEDGVSILEEYTKYADVEFADGAVAYALPKNSFRIC